MMLRSIDFIQYEDKPLEWRLEGLTLGQINLIVGRNASGKSKVLNAIHQLARMVSGAPFPSDRTGSYVARFLDPENIYVLQTRDARVLHEELSVDGQKKLIRDKDGAGELYFDRLNRFVDFQSPESEVVCGNRRDSIQHPYFEEIYDWGKRALFYGFDSGSLGKGMLAFIPEPMVEHPLILDSLAVPGILRAIHAIYTDAFSGELRAAVIQDMKRLGYPLTAIRTKRIVKRADPREDGNLVSLCVVEDGLGESIDQFDMSDGMFRALVILIEVTYAAMSGKPSLVLIDDIGEGLDYERSCRLIELLIDKAKKSGIQLVMATNDRFVMNNVPLEYWTLLLRERAERGTRVKVYNYETHKKVFDDFAYTGLNNFDFFATRFFEEGLDAAE